MAKLLVEVSHTKEECLQALDDILEKGGPEYLDEFEWGCQDGNHTGWAVVDAKNKSAAKKMIPQSVRGKSNVTEVSKFTPQQLRAYHEKIDE